MSDPGVIKWNRFRGGSNLMQMYGSFEGFPLNSASFGLVSCNDPCSKALQKVFPLVRDEPFSKGFLDEPMCISILSLTYLIW